MPNADFDQSVFINCPFDAEYAPLLESMLFCVVRLGFVPRLANERVEAGENRLDKIVDLIKSCKYSIHDLSRSIARDENDAFRMNMPFEYGIDVGFRRCGNGRFRQKKFLIFEEKRYELKRALSDIAGQDVEAHDNKYERVIRKVREFFRVEAGVNAPGATLLYGEYATFLGWMTEKKIYEGHSEEEAKDLPTRERLDEMRRWNDIGRPDTFNPNQHAYN